MPKSLVSVTALAFETAAVIGRELAHSFFKGIWKVGCSQHLRELVKILFLTFFCLLMKSRSHLDVF